MLDQPQHVQEQPRSPEVKFRIIPKFSGQAQRPWEDGSPETLRRASHANRGLLTNAANVEGIRVWKRNRDQPMERVSSSHLPKTPVNKSIEIQSMDDLEKWNSPSVMPSTPAHGISTGHEVPATGHVTMPPRSDPEGEESADSSAGAMP